MRARRLIIIPAIAAFGFAGSVLASPVTVVSVGHVASINVQKHTVVPLTYYHT